MARTAKTNLKVRNAGLELSSVFDTIDLLSGITAADDGGGIVGFTGTGGSGFTTLAATETPSSDGSVKVFTFSTAAAQPSWIISDGVWMRAITKKGTINWTWSAGAKQATMAVGPQDEILGVV